MPYLCIDVTILEGDEFSCKVIDHFLDIPAGDFMVAIAFSHHGKELLEVDLPRYRDPVNVLRQDVQGIPGDMDLIDLFFKRAFQKDSALNEVIPVQDHKPSLCHC